MTTREKAPTGLTRRQQAEGRLAVIRNALQMADEELERVLVEKDWEVFGLSSFEDYCATMLPDLKHIKLRKPERLARHKRIFDAGGTERMAAASSGSSVGTAHNDRLELSGRAPVLKNEQAPSSLVATLTGADIAAATNWQTVLRYVRQAGDDGLTVLEFLERVPPRAPDDKRSPWHHGSASPAFLDAERKGYIRRLEVFRRGYAVHVTVTR